MKNKSKLFFLTIILETGEKTQMLRDEPTQTFFNFFSNLRTPTEDEIKSLDFEIEKELGTHFDTEFELGIEIVEELIPHSLEYFCAIKHDFEEYAEYAQSHIGIDGEKKKKTKK